MKKERFNIHSPINPVTTASLKENNSELYVLLIQN